MIDPKIFLRMKESLRFGRDPAALARAVAVCKEAGAQARPRYWHAVFARDLFFSLFSPFARESTHLDSLLRHADRICCTAASLAPGVDERSGNYLRRGERLRGEALNKAATILVESEMQRSSTKVSFEWGKKGYASTRLFRPGEGDFSQEAERVFPELVDSEDMTLWIGSDGRIRPRTTRLALFGLIPDRG